MHAAVIAVSVWTVLGFSGNLASPAPISVQLYRGDSPNFVGYLESLDKHGRMMVDLLPHSALPVTDPRRHYIIIFGVLSSVVEYLNSDCLIPEYDKQFLPTVDRMLPFIWQYPETPVSKINTFIFDINNAVEQIREVQDYYCRNTTSSECNDIIDAITSDRDEFIKARDVLLSAGELADMYQKNPYIEEARTYKEVSLLLTGVEKLKPLVLQASKVYNFLYGKACYKNNR